MERQTKIIATLGPACASRESVGRLVEAGMDVARLNFSHGDHPGHRRFATWVRQAAEEAGRPVALMQDIQGLKIRVGTFPGGAVELEPQQEVRLRPGTDEGRNGTIYIDYAHLLEDLEPGQEIILAEGLLRLQVVGQEKSALKARVVEGGTLSDRKGVALPGSSLQARAVTAKDRDDLELGRELGVDYVAASFVRCADDLHEVETLVEKGTPIIAKIELASAYQNLDEILSATQGVIVARGDLGVEIPLERLPLVQREILHRSNRAGRVSITATEMLESMTQAPRPTRAEVTDVANSVLQGTDAVLLSGETAVGRYPVRVVSFMASICREAEAGSDSREAAAVEFLAGEEPFPSATAKAAVEAATNLGLETIVAFTETGNTARLISKYRPRARVLAFTPEPATYRRMTLYRGVRPFLFQRLESTDEMIAAAERYLLESGVAPPGEGVIMVAGVPPHHRASTNLMKVHRLGEGGGTA